MKFTPVMLSSSSKNTQFLEHLKSSSVLQLIKGKSTDLQILLRYLSRIATSVFKGGIDSGG